MMTIVVIVLMMLMAVAAAVMVADHRTQLTLAGYLQLSQDNLAAKHRQSVGQVKCFLWANLD